MTKEFKPGFKGWLFSIIIAAGLGSLVADGIKYLVIEANKTGAILIVQDKICYLSGDNIQCDYYIENVGDKTAFITDVLVDGKDHPKFYTNNPIRISSEDKDEPVQRASVAIAEPNNMLLISISISKLEKKPNEVCFKYGDETVLCE